MKQGKAVKMTKDMAETDKCYCFFEALDACLNALYVIIGTNGTSFLNLISQLCIYNAWVYQHIPSENEM